MKLVTRSQASAWVRRDTEDDNDRLDFIIEAVTEEIMEYLGDAVASFTDSSGALIEDSSGNAVGVPRRVQAAALFYIDYQYNNGDDSTDNNVPDQFGYGYMPFKVVRMLFPLRRPTVA